MLSITAQNLFQNYTLKNEPVKHRQMLYKSSIAATLRLYCFSNFSSEFEEV